MRLNNTQRQVGLIGAAKLVNIGVRSFYFLFFDEILAFSLDRGHMRARSGWLGV
jgi:hypothetical protein